MAGLEITKFDDRWGVTWESVGFYPEEIEIKMGMQINRFPKMGRGYPQSMAFKTKMV